MHQSDVIFLEALTRYGVHESLDVPVSVRHVEIMHCDCQIDSDIGGRIEKGGFDECFNNASICL